jgi:hypothetical protein
MAKNPARLKLIHLYPDAMNLYGDFGNILTLKKRCEWRGIHFEVQNVGAGDPVDWGSVDLIFLGGGQDRGQELIASDLQSRGKEIKDAVEDGVSGLLVCGGYQLFGQYFQTSEGNKIPGIGVLPAHTVAGPVRMIGNLVGKHSLPLIPPTIVGFENHSGETMLDKDAIPLAQVVRGYGNNREGKTEGIVYKNLIGTYCHGSLLPKNPHLADHLIRMALDRRFGRADLSELDDNIELAAHHAAIKRAETAETLHI